MSKINSLLDYCQSSYWQNLKIPEILNWIEAVTWSIRENDSILADGIWSCEIDLSGFGRVKEDFQEPIDTNENLYEFLLWAAKRQTYLQNLEHILGQYVDPSKS